SGAGRRAAAQLSRAARPMAVDVRTPTPAPDRLPRPAAPRSRPRSRFGYDHRWWGEASGPPAPASAEGDDAPYWAVTRRPLPCLAFVLPVLLAYELGVCWIGGTASPAQAQAWRTGADAWTRHALAALGMTDRWFPPLCLAMALLLWQALSARPWRFEPMVLLG